MTKYGIGASVLRKEDDRFLRGRGQYVADYRMAGMREVAFVRSPVAHARLKRIHVPDEFRDCVFTAQHLIGVKPIVSCPPLKGFKYSVEPILAADKLRYVGEMAAICLAQTRAQAEDIAAAVTLEFDELPAVTDMIAACQPGSPLVHEDWGDNIFVEFNENGAIEEIAKSAAIKVSKTIRTARHCMFPMEGRGVVAFRDSRLRYLTLVTSTQFPHSVQTGLCECLGLVQLYEQFYCQRGEMENRIKEQMCLFAYRLSTEEMKGNQLRLYLLALAYTLVEALRRLALKGTEWAEAQVDTIRLKLFKIGALVRISARRVWLEMNSFYPWKHIYARVFDALRC